MFLPNNSVIMKKAAFLKSIKHFSVGIDETNDESCSVKIKVDSCAICGSDIRIFNHGNDRINYPAIIGHEVSGTVVETRNEDFKIGDKLSLGADIPCGKCKECINHKPNLCKQNLAIGYQLKGGFAEYMDLDARIFNYGPVVKLEDDLDLELACLGEPLACSLNGVEKVHMNRNGKVLIFGAGPIGIMLGFLAKSKYKCERLDFVEVNPFRKKSLEDLDIANNIYDHESLQANFNNLKKSYNYVFTACSIFQTHKDGIKLLENGGAINFFGGLPKPSPSLELITNELHYRELLLTGSHGSTPSQHKRAVQIIKENQSFFKSLITNRFPLEDISQAFQFASSGKGIKVIIKP